jgi:hypothetical protein
MTFGSKTLERYGEMRANLKVGLLIILAGQMAQQNFFKLIDDHKKRETGRGRKDRPMPKGKPVSMIIEELTKVTGP